jgi:hypothetical protein
MKYIRYIAFTIFFLLSLSVLADSGAHSDVLWLPVLVQSDTKAVGDIDRRTTSVVRPSRQALWGVNNKVSGFKGDDAVNASLKFLYLRGNYLRGNYFSESDAAPDGDAHNSLTAGCYGRDVGISLISAGLTFGLGVKELKELRS